MELWIPVTIAAAFAQNLRFMLQKHLKATRLSTGGATFARFLYSAPLVAIILALYVTFSGMEMPRTSARFWAFALTGGLSQIVATMCVVAIFAHRNFAVGITFKKTEVLQAALVGFVVLGEGLSVLGLAAILIGFVGLVILSDAPEAIGAWHRRIFNRAAGLGLASGILFAISGVGYRGASLALELGQEDLLLRAIFTLAMVTAFQTAAMVVWLGFREAGEVTRVARHWRVGALVGLTSMIGSLCWFFAFTLQTVAYVKALGQIELVFSFIASVFVFRERTTLREGLGMVLLVCSILLLILAL